jgi:hypothetical protein
VSGRSSRLPSAGDEGATSGERITREPMSLCGYGATAPHIKGQTEVQSWPLLLSGQRPGQSALCRPLLAALGAVQPAVANAGAAVKEDSNSKAQRMRVNRRSISVIRSVADQWLQRHPSRIPCFRPIGDLRLSNNSHSCRPIVSPEPAGMACRRMSRTHNNPRPAASGPRRIQCSRRNTDRRW